MHYTFNVALQYHYCCIMGPLPLHYGTITIGLQFALPLHYSIITQKVEIDDIPSGWICPKFGQKMARHYTFPIYYLDHLNPLSVVGGTAGSVNFDGPSMPSETWSSSCSSTTHLIGLVLVCSSSTNTNVRCLNEFWGYDSGVFPKWQGKTPKWHNCWLFSWIGPLLRMQGGGDTLRTLQKWIFPIFQWILMVTWLLGSLLNVICQTSSVRALSERKRVICRNRRFVRNHAGLQQLTGSPKILILNNKLNRKGLTWQEVQKEQDGNFPVR